MSFITERILALEKTYLSGNTRTYFLTKNGSCSRSGGMHSTNANAYGIILVDCTTIALVSSILLFG